MVTLINDYFRNRTMPIEESSASPDLKFTAIEHGISNELEKAEKTMKKKGNFDQRLVHSKFDEFMRAVTMIIREFEGQKQALEADINRRFEELKAIISYEVHSPVGKAIVEAEKRMLLHVRTAVRIDIKFEMREAKGRRPSIFTNFARLGRKKKRQSASLNHLDNEKLYESIRTALMTYQKQHSKHLEEQILQLINNYEDWFKIACTTLEECTLEEMKLISTLDHYILFAQTFKMNDYHTALISLKSRLLMVARGDLRNEELLARKEEELVNLIPQLKYDERQKMGILDGIKSYNYKPSSASPVN